MEEDREIAYMETKLINKFALHKLLENGGTIKLNSMVFGVSHNPDNPNNPNIEIKIGFIPVGETYKGHINPTLSKKVEKKESIKKIIVEEDDEEII